MITVYCIVYIIVFSFGIYHKCLIFLLGYKFTKVLIIFILLKLYISIDCTSICCLLIKSSHSHRGVIAQFGEHVARIMFVILIFNTGMFISATGKLHSFLVLYLLQGKCKGWDESSLARCTNSSILHTIALYHALTMSFYCSLVY